MSDRIELLGAAGRALHGRDWQRALAADLGPLHPDGPRSSIDDRLVRRWAAGDRAIPDWVGSALAELLTERQDVIAEAIAELDRW